jgi:hypothetical protein
VVKPTECINVEIAPATRDAARNVVNGKRLRSASQIQARQKLIARFREILSRRVATSDFAIQIETLKERALAMAF